MIKLLKRLLNHLEECDKQAKIMRNEDRYGCERSLILSA